MLRKTFAAADKSLAILARNILPTIAHHAMCASRISIETFLSLIFTIKHFFKGEPMRKPDGYDGAEAKNAGFREPVAGPCILGIIRATAGKSDNGNPQLTIELDIADGPFKNFYREKSERFNQSWYLKHWQGTEGKSIPYFKGLIVAIEESNPGYKFDFNEATLSRKLIGGNLREEEYAKKDGSIGVRMKIAYLCSLQSVTTGGHKVLPTKKLVSAASREPGVDDIPPENYDQRQPEGPMPF
jgi:hypothetical protein